MNSITTEQDPVFSSLEVATEERPDAPNTVTNARSLDTAQHFWRKDENRLMLRDMILDERSRIKAIESRYRAIADAAAAEVATMRETSAQSIAGPRRSWTRFLHPLTKHLKRVMPSVQLESAPLPPVTPPEAGRPIEIDYSAKVPFQFPTLKQLKTDRVAAVIHLFYPELAPEFRVYLNNIPVDVDVYISTCDSFSAELIQNAFKGWAKGTVEVRVVPNRGRDIAPKLLAFKSVFERYDFILCLHGKRSHHASALAQWRHFLLESLCGSAEVVSSVLYAFEHDPNLGMIAAQHFETMRHWTNWGGNFDGAQTLANRLGFAIDKSTPLDFPSGSMFWTRAAALKNLVELNLSFDDFPAEANQTDATLAHSIERLFFYACEHAGFHWMKIARPELYDKTPAMIAIASAPDLKAFANHYVFRLLDPKGVKIRAVRPTPIAEPPRRLADVIQQRALGLPFKIPHDTKVAIGIVTYNNDRAELQRAIEAARISLSEAGLPVENNLYLLDNGNSTEHYDLDRSFLTRLQSEGNVGFGAGHNRLMRAAFKDDADIYICLNPDGILHPDAIGSLVKAVLAADGRSLVEALQFPSEHPKPYDPLTLETPWVSGACLAISRTCFEELGGFDDSFFMYCEDVDLSWRARALGFSLKTCPQALFLHRVTNRKMSVSTVEMIYTSACLLARKWRGAEFEQWVQSEMDGLGKQLPQHYPEPVPVEWSKIADFTAHTSFAKPRW
ncbi:GT2 family glycosyltransferase [Paraburkholderia youngii]|uniref:rhamnan synthesis F family protein n=1 Tax=Paraburkholderia youngii TaxID=2782701 RepID=UPI003D191350